jgi:hypothetical protein
MQQKNNLWRISPISEYATCHAERYRVVHVDVKLQEQCTYLHHGLITSSTATLTFKVQILILVDLIGDRLLMLHFYLALHEYDMTNKFIDKNECEMVMRKKE